MTLQHPHAELSAYIDGALEPAAQAAVQGHVAACAVCRAHVAELRATVALVHALPDPVPSRRLMPRLAAGPAWLAPLRTVMTFASGTAVFLFIASSLVSNITFLASGSATTAQERSRDTSTAFRVDAPAPGQAGGASTGAPAPAASLNEAARPTASPAAVSGPGSSPTADDASKRSVQSTTAPVAPGAGAPGTGAPQDAGSQLAFSEPQRSPLLNPWLWLTLAVLTGAIAIALQRRLRGSV